LEEEDHEERDVYAFFETVRGVLGQPSLPPRMPGELRPLVGYTFTADPDNTIFYDVNEHGIDLEYFKKLLLYYNRVGLVVHTEAFAEMQDPETAEGLMKLLLKIKPLIEKDVIFFVNEIELYNVSPSVRHELSGLTGREIPSYLHTSDFESRIIADLNGCSRFDLDYVTTNRDQWDQVNALQRRAGAAGIERDISSLWATSLLQFQLPNLHRLSYPDLIAIREHSEALDGWRALLSEVIAHVVLTNPVSLEQAADAIQYLAKHRFAERRAKILDEIRQSSLKNHVKANSLNLTLSFLGLFMAGNIVGIDTKDIVTLALGSNGPLAVLLYLLEQRRLERHALPVQARYFSLFQEADA
jgi:hypothetical protein